MDVLRLLQLNNLVGVASHNISSFLGGAQSAASGAGSAVRASVGSLQQRSAALPGRPPPGGSGNGAGSGPGQATLLEEGTSLQGTVKPRYALQFNLDIRYGLGRLKLISATESFVDR